MTTRYRVVPGGRPYEGARLVGTPEHLNVIYTWMESYGLQRLLDPTPENEPFDRGRMIDGLAARHTPGFYVDSDTGVLVIRNNYRQVLEADYGDWVMRDVTNNNFIVAKEPVMGKLFIEEEGQ